MRGIRLCSLNIVFTFDFSPRLCVKAAVLARVWFLTQQAHLCRNRFAFANAHHDLFPNNMEARSQCAFWVKPVKSVILGKNNASASKHFLMVYRSYRIPDVKDKVLLMKIASGSHYLFHFSAHSLAYLASIWNSSMWEKYILFWLALRWTTSSEMLSELDFCG